MCLRSKSNRGRNTSTFPAEFDVSSQVVLVRVGILVTFYTKSGSDLSVRNEELNLTENTTRGEVSAAHITELTSTRTVDGRGVTGTTGTRNGVYVYRVTRSTTDTRPLSRGQNTSGGVQGVDTTRIGEGRYRNEVTSISRNLLEEGGDGGNLILYLDWRKYFCGAGVDGKEYLK